MSNRKRELYTFEVFINLNLRLYSNGTAAFRKYGTVKENNFLLPSEHPTNEAFIIFDCYRIYKIRYKIIN